MKQIYTVKFCTQTLSRLILVANKTRGNPLRNAITMATVKINYKCMIVA